MFFHLESIQFGGVDAQVVANFYHSFSSRRDRSQHSPLLCGFSELLVLQNIHTQVLLSECLFRK